VAHIATSRHWLVQLAVGTFALLAIPGCPSAPFRLPLIGDSQPAAEKAGEKPPPSAAKSVAAAKAGKAGNVANRNLPDLTSPHDVLAYAGPSWVRKVAAPGVPSDDSPRWSYGALEQLLASPGVMQIDLPASAKETNPIVATNAAIGLARRNDSSASQVLVAAVGDPRLPLEMRCAAAEALARCDKPSPVEAIRKLIDQGSGTSGTRSLASAAEIHAELLRGLARHVDPAEDPRYAKALRNADPGVRIEALMAWANGRKGTLPADGIEQLKAPESPVRIAAIRAVAQRRPPKAHAVLTPSLDDRDLQVRFAAIAAMGELGGTEARAPLTHLLEDRAETIRAAAIAALQATGDQQAVFAAKTDKAWQVRLVVAESLAAYPGPEAEKLARELLDDPSTTVQLRVLTSIRNWPPQSVAPVCWDAMGKNSYRTRSMAAGQLAALWPPAAEFPIDATPRRRMEFFTQWQDDFRRRFPDSAAGAVRQASHSEIATPEKRTAEAKALLAQVASPNNLARRQAIERLAALFDEAPLDPSVLARAVEVLLPVLGESHVETVSAAARALGATGPANDPRVPERLKQLLTAPNEGLRVEAAAALVRLGDPAGVAALDRLAYSHDSRIRRQTAAAMGRTGNPAFAHSLVRLLGDQYAVQLAALDSLTKVAGDVPADLAEQPTVKRLEYWKRRFADH
jgi:HEAT repeat protein